MCHSDESRPPAPPISGVVGARGELTLTASDGNVFDAYEAHPSQPSTRGVVILPDIRGLHGYYKDLAARFAEAGFHAVAFDYYARTAGRGDRSEAFEFMPHFQQSQPQHVTADVEACVAKLRMDGVASIFTLGFCFGGSNSWRQSAEIAGLAGCIGFYGRPLGVTEVEDRLQAPLLLLLAGADQSIKPDDFDASLARLTARGLYCERHVYPGAPHSFFDRSFRDHADACADAWKRILAFTDRFANPHDLGVAHSRD